MGIIIFSEKNNVDILDIKAYIFKNFSSYLLLFFLKIVDKNATHHTVLTFLGLSLWLAIFSYTELTKSMPHGS